MGQINVYGSGSVTSAAADGTALPIKSEYADQ